MVNPPKYKIFNAPLLNPLSDTRCEYWLQGCLVLEKHANNTDYTILYAGPQHDQDHVFKKAHSKEVFDFPDHLIMPGFIDLHFHWVQDDVRQKPKKELLTWLQEYTWPHEAKFRNETYSRTRAQQFAHYLLKTGTLSGAIYGSPHAHTVHHAHEHFIGDFVVGNVLMTMNSPPDLTQPMEQAYTELKQLAEEYSDRYAVTPRIAAVTDPQLMKQAAIVANQTGAFIQTHLSETRDEIDWILKLYKDIPGFERVTSYTEIYNRCQLLQNKTILGHCIHLDEAELELIQKSKAAIAHCPTSNAPVSEGGLGSGLFDFSLAEKYSIPWGLGSDIGGGPWLSMFDVIHSFVEQNHKQQRMAATYTKGLYRATLKSAEILQMDKMTGNLAPGKWGNFLTVPFAKAGYNHGNAESVLRSLIRPFAKERQKFDGLVDGVFYKGHPVYRSKLKQHNR